MVYFIAIDGTEYVKVGRANNIDKRLASLATANPLDISVRRIIKTTGYLEDRLLEKQIHAHLKDCRVKGEWFLLSDERLAQVVNHFENAEAYRLNPILEARYICLRSTVEEVDGHLQTVTEPCFFCRVKHLHGAGDAVQQIGNILTYGHRVAHCPIRHLERRHPSGKVLDNAYGYYLWVEQPM